MTTTQPTLSRLNASPTCVFSRIAAALPGTYAFCWGFVSLAIVLLVASGTAYDDAQMLAMMLAFPLYLVLFLWAFAARSMARVWLVLAAGAVVMTLTAQWLAKGAGVVG